MASMVAKACSTTSNQMPSITTVQEKASRNKRKFRADPPLADPTKAIPLPLNESTSFEFSAEKFDNHIHTPNVCDVCCLNQDSNSNPLKLDLGLSCQPREDQSDSSIDEFHDANWSDLTESELEELVLSNLDTIFRSAIKKIVSNGYSEEVATKAILRSGLWYGCRDTVSNIVDNTLAFLKSGHQEIDDLSNKENQYFEDLQQMERYILAELVCLLREVRPFFSTGDAMWCLLVCDMNVSHACAMDGGDPFGGGSLNDAHAPNMLGSCKPNALVVHAHNPKVANSKAKASSFVTNGLVPDKDFQNPTSNIVEKPFSTGRKVSGITKREYILRQKSLHFEKHYRTYGSSKSTSNNRANKISTFSGLVLDKKLKGVADSAGLNSKNATFKINKAPAHHDLSTAVGSTPGPTFGLEPVDRSSSSLPKSSTFSPSLPVADTELSLTFPPTKGIIANPMPISCNKIEAASSSSSDDKSIGQWTPQDRKEEMIMKLAPRLRELQNQLQEWTEWANQKVMQAARRLSKDKAELKTLKQEREEVERLKREKQALEENTMKKLSEMENALRKASGQVERANGAVRRLEVENKVLRREMEAARLRALESAASYEEVSKREKNTMVKFQSWEKQKGVSQEELSAERLKLSQMQEKLRQAKDVWDQVEAKLNQEKKSNDELLTQATSFRKEREQIEVSTQSKEDAIKSKAETNLQKHKSEIERLEKEISQLRLKSDSSKIAALRRGIDGTYASKLADQLRDTTNKDSAMSYISANFTLNGGVKRERECVMCLSEEMSVVFLPCAHQVVCITCNELHEKQGMKDCPSCRGPIKRRVCVRFAHS